MKKSKITKIVLLLAVIIMCLASASNIAYAAESKMDWASICSKKEFSPAYLLIAYNRESVMGTEKAEVMLANSITNVNANDSANIKYEYNELANNKIDTMDSTFLLQMMNETNKNYKSSIQVKNVYDHMMKKWNCKDEDIEVKTTIAVKDEVLTYLKECTETFDKDAKIFKNGSNQITLSSKTSTEQDSKDVADAVAKLATYDTDATTKNAMHATVKVDVILYEGKVKYNLVLGKDANGLNWYFVPETIDFSTKLDYTAKIGEKSVGGQLVNEVYSPNYDKEQVKKDADVTATITSINDYKLDILETNGVALKTDGKANSEGWYYPNVEDKTVIAKVYPFEDYNNLKDNGMVKENVKLTGEYGTEDTQTVNIKWPFRIIEVIYNPEKITEDTEKVTVTIITNLPMEEDALPDGWKFTSDELGKTQHSIYKEYLKKDKDQTENVIVTANERPTDKDNTDIKVDFPDDKTPPKEDDTQTPNKIPQAGSTSIIVVAIIAVAGYAFAKYRKLRGIKNIK